MAKAFGNLRRTLSAIACLSFVFLPGILLAQNYDDPGLGQKPVAAHPQDYKPLGIRAGSFMLHPGLELAVEFNDNVFYSTLIQESDTIYHIRPYITAQSTWSKHSLSVRLAADIGRYSDFGFRDYEDFFFIIGGKVDVKTQSYFSYGANYMRLHEDLNTRSAEQGREQTVYTLIGGNLGYDHTFNRLSVGGMYTFSALDFENAVALDGDPIDNEDRDRDVSSWMLRAGYQFKTDIQGFVAYTGNKVKYDQRLDRNGFDRSSDGYTLTGGVSFMITGKLNGDVAMNYFDQNYDDPRLEDISGWGGSAGLQWKATDLTSVYGQIVSGVEQTTNPNSSGYLRTLYSLRVDHELLRYLQLNGFISYSDFDYQLTNDAPEDARSSDKIFRAGFGVNWFINRWLYLSASYDYEKLTTNVPNQDYDVNRIWLTLGMER